MNPKLADLLAFARWKAVRDVPYLSRGLFACSYIESPDVETFAIDDRWRVLVNPAFAERCAAEGTLAAALVHECLHPMLKHKARGRAIGAEDPKQWNVCGDCEINHRIDEVPGLKLPSVGVRASTYGWEPGLAAEEYYRHPPPSGGKGPGKDGGCSGGSGAGAPHAAEAGLPEGEGEGVSQGEADMIRAAVAQAIKDQAVSKPGSVPEGMLRWAEEFGEPPAIDWRQLVQARVRYACAARKGPAPSYARPSRRSMGCNMILPVYRQPLPKVTLVVDTSGSMGQGDIGTALATVVEACEAIGHVKAVACDAAAGDAIDVRHIDDLRDYLLGGGGTDMKAGIARAAETSPDCIVVCTDGETDWPREAPDAPVVVVLTRASGYPVPLWAQVVKAY